MQQGNGAGPDVSDLVEAVLPKRDREEFLRKATGVFDMVLRPAHGIKGRDAGRSSLIEEARHSISESDRASDIGNGAAELFTSIADAGLDATQKAGNDIVHADSYEAAAGDIATTRARCGVTKELAEETCGIGCTNDTDCTSPDARCHTGLESCGSKNNFMWTCGNQTYAAYDDSALTAAQSVQPQAGGIHVDAPHSPKHVLAARRSHVLKQPAAICWEPLSWLLLAMY